MAAISSKDSTNYIVIPATINSVNCSILFDDSDIVGESEKHPRLQGNGSLNIKSTTLKAVLFHCQYIQIGSEIGDFPQKTLSKNLQIPVKVTSKTSLVFVPND